MMILMINRVLDELNPQPDYQSDEEPEVLAKIIVKEAEQAIQLLRLYEEQQDDCRNGFIEALDSHNDVLHERKQSGLQQQLLTSWIT